MWEEFVTDYQGRSYLSPKVGNINHPATPLLQMWMTEGLLVHTSNEPWTLQQKDKRLLRSCHLSTTEHKDFLRDKLTTFMDNHFWMVLPYQLVRHLERLQLSPAGVKPERDQ